MGYLNILAFQYTLSTIQQLSFVSDYKQILSNQLGDAAIEISTSMLSDLEALGRYFESLSEKAEVDTNILLKFSSPSSEETKLLRVLKSIDFLYLSASSPESKAIAQTSISVLADENSMLLRQLYDTFNLKNVWSQLSNLLRVCFTSSSLIYLRLSTITKKRLMLLMSCYR